jgi:hypothetical protein
LRGVGESNGASKFSEYGKQRAGGQTKLFDEKVLVEAGSLLSLTIRKTPFGAFF